MKIQLAPIFKNSLFFLTFLLTFNLEAQEQRLEFNAGIGPPLDVFHLGINLQLNQKLDIGFSGGSIAIDDLGNHINIGVESKYKFGESKTLKGKQEINGKYKNVKLKTWYGGFRINYVKNVHTAFTTKQLINITPAIGRHCNFNKFMGLNIDFGLSFTALEDRFFEGNGICHQCFLDEHPQYPLLPTLRIQFFVKL